MRLNANEESAVHKSYELVTLETSQCILNAAYSDIMDNDMSASHSARM